jgi:hypothetical protein
VRRERNHDNKKLDRRASDAWHRLLAERGLGYEDVVMTQSSSPLTPQSPSVPPPQAPPEVTMKASLVRASSFRGRTKCKSREDVLRKISIASRDRRRSRESRDEVKRRSGFSLQRSRSLAHMKMGSKGSTGSIPENDDVIIAAVGIDNESSQNRFIMSKSRGKSSGALLASSRKWKDTPRTKHQRTLSREENFIVKFELLMKNTKTRWRLPGQSSWSPRRFEVEGGVLKIFRKGSARAVR